MQAESSGAVRTTRIASSPSSRFGVPPHGLMKSDELAHWAEMPSADRAEALRTDHLAKKRFLDSVRWYRDNSSPKLPRTEAGISPASVDSALAAQEGGCEYLNHISPERIPSFIERSISPHQSAAIETTPDHARRFDDTLELRSLVLSLLDDRSLAAFMRVERDCMPSVARLIYRTITFDKFASLAMAAQTETIPLYLSAVRHIDATTMTISRSVARYLEISHVLPTGHMGAFRRPKSAWLRAYHQDLIGTIVPPLAERCNGLRDISLGHPYAPLGDPSWVVHVLPSQALMSVDAAPPVIEPTDWCVEYVETHHFKHREGPLGTVKVPEPPSHHLVRARFDLSLNSIDVELFATWLTSLEDNTPYQDIYKCVAFGNLPVTLPIITHIINQQIAARHEKRLSTIIACAISQWQHSSFREFSLAASSSLTSLLLAKRYSEKVGMVSPADLADLTSLIRTNLPNLRELHFAMGDISSAEAVCQQMLNNDLLDTTGTIESLRMYTDVYTKPVFNVVRLLGYICSRGAILQIEHANKAESTSHQEGRFLEILRKQVANRRGYLSAVNFPSLGVTKYNHIAEIRYHTDGRPYTRAQSWAERWEEKEQRNQAAAFELLYRLHSGLLDYQVATEAFGRIPSDASRLEQLHQVQTLSGVADVFERVAEEFRCLLSEKESVREEMKEFETYLFQQVGPRRMRRRFQYSRHSPSPTSEEEYV